GFIGSHLVEKLLTLGNGVAILDDFNDFYDPQIKRANIAAVKNDASVFQIDLRDNNAVRDLFHREKFDAIAHLAARAGVRPSIAQPQLDYDANVTGTLHLLDAARTAGIERFIFASSSSVYGISKTVPFSEELHLKQTISPYAATKIAGEFLCSTFSHLYQIRMIALRLFTVYGPRQRPDLAIHQFTRKILAGQTIDQFGDGTTRRDYTYIDDIIQGVIAALKYDGVMWDIFNLGENETVQLKDLIKAIETAGGRKAKINQLRGQPEWEKMDYGHFPIADFRERFETVAFDPKNAGKDLLVLMMETYAEMLGISLDSVVRWVEKTPANRRFIPEILERFPHAKLLITMRDPRAILAAQIALEKTRKTRAFSVYYCVSHWLQAAQLALRAERKEISGIVTRYEDLVADPTSPMRRVCNFLEISFDRSVVLLPTKAGK